MKKLFAIREASTNKLLPNLFFSDKMQAKTYRESVNPKDDNNKEVMKYVVTYGPDHRKFVA